MVYFNNTAVVAAAQCNCTFNKDVSAIFADTFFLLYFQSLRADDNNNKLLLLNHHSV